MAEFANLDTGLNAKEMTTYWENLNAELITGTAEKINDVTEIITALDNNWNGHSKKVFVEQFEQARGQVIEDLDKEKALLENKLQQLQKAYFEIDTFILNDNE